MTADAKSKNPWAMDNENPDKKEWRCATCGKILKYKTPYCFEHRNLLLSDEEQQREAAKAKAEAGTLEPEEDEDYYVQHEYKINVEAYGHVFAFADEPSDKYNGWDSDDIEWDELDISHWEKTGRKRLMGFDGQPFDVTKWLAEKRKGKKPTNVGKAKFKQSIINDFTHEPAEPKEGCKDDTLGA